MKLFKTIQRLALVSAGTGLAVIGSVGSAHAFNFTESSDAGSFLANSESAGAAVPTPPSLNTIQGVLAGAGTGFDFSDVFEFQLGFDSDSSFGFSVVPTGPGPLSLYLFNNAGTLLAQGTGTISYNVLTAGSLPPTDYYIGITDNLVTALNASSTTLQVGETLGGWTGPTAGRSTARNYTIAASFEPVPEPLTLLGGAAALGVGGMMQRKRKQRQLKA